MKKLILLLSLSFSLQACPFHEMKEKVVFLDEVINQFCDMGYSESKEVIYLIGLRDGLMEAMMIVDEDKTKIFLTYQ